MSGGLITFCRASIQPAL